MDSISIQKKEELFLQVHKEIEKAKIIVSQSRKSVAQAKQQSDRIKNQTGTYFPTLKDSSEKK